MKDVQDLIPWKVIDLGVRPFSDLWSFNNSIHFDGMTWRCVLRCADYCMPEGKTVRKNGGSTGQQTKNAMLILDPQSWKPIQIYKMHEKDGLPRASTPHVGFEDMRLFRTDKGGLQGIAASLHLKRDQRVVDGKLPHQPPEQVVLSFDDEYNIIAAQPIRGDGWSGTSQKNWVPFDHCAEARFLYAIEKGALFGEDGPLHGDAARVRPSTCSLPAAFTSTSPPLELPIESEPAPEQRLRRSDFREKKIRGGDVRVVRGGRLKLDTMTSRPSARPSSRSGSRTVTAHSADDSTRLMGAGRVGLPKYKGLRGGTQLVRVADGAWLGIGHEMKWTNNKKFYWHVFYTVDDRGKMTAVSEPMKLAPNGIEFAAGMAIDGERVVVSFGVDDMNSMLSETMLSAVMEMLRPVER
jgi:hypothetical protein